MPATRAAALGVATILYAGLKLLPLRRRVVFISRQSDSPSRDFRMLAQELLDRDPSIEIRFLCRRMDNGVLGRVKYVAELVRQMYHLAVSRVCVVDGYAIPVSMLAHRPELFVMQLWHALGTIKQFGYQSLDRPGGRPARLAREMRMHRNYDVILCGSEAMVPIFAEAFDTPAEKVRPLGLPRADYLAERARPGRRVSSKVAALRERYPRLAGPTTSILYAPTYRPSGESFLTDVAAAVDPERFTLVVKPHDLTDDAVSGEHVVDATGISILDLLLACDVVVTDYSAVAFEACIIGKPMYFYVPDIAAYETTQGLNIDPREVLPSATSTDIADVLGAIEAGTEGARASAWFRENYVSFEPGRCTASIADVALGHLGAPAR